jgi:GH25 family lysozyme M1 (1,4-beta-N-acetylmuramidase)
MSVAYGVDFAKDMKINRFKLNEDCEAQPSLYHFYAHEYALARSERDAAKDALDLVMGQREMAIRLNPPEVKITEAVITALLVQDEEVQSAKKALREAQTKVDILYASTSALEHRRSELDNLVSMWVKDYYSGKQDEVETSLRNNLNKPKGE